MHQAVFESANNMQRTCLHIACERNLIGSHSPIIDVLIGIFGANVMLTDRHGKRPLDLLIGGKSVGYDSPSASREREEVIIERREEYLQRLTDEVFNASYRIV